MKDLMNYWDVKDLALVAATGMMAGVAWFAKLGDSMAASVPTEFLVTEVMPWVTLIGISVTSSMAIMNRLDKLRENRRRKREEKADKEAEADSP